jgi:hypothetical protein
VPGTTDETLNVRFKKRSFRFKVTVVSRNAAAEVHVDPLFVDFAYVGVVPSFNPRANQVLLLELYTTLVTLLITS